MKMYESTLTTLSNCVEVLFCAKNIHLSLCQGDQC